MTGSPAAGNHFRKVARGVGRFVTWPWHPHMIQAKPTIIELDMDKLEEILRRLEAKELATDDYETIKAVIGSYTAMLLIATLGYLYVAFKAPSVKSKHLPF